MVCIGFDGRKDNVLTDYGIQKEDHYVVAKESEGEYIDHLCPDSGSAICIANELLTFMTDIKSNNSLKAIFGNDTPVNTGRVGREIILIQSNL